MANTYNTAKSDYETKKTAYNKALADEKTRKADFFKAMFEPAVVIPERPCQPTRPGAFSGLDFTFATTTITDAEKGAKKAVFTQNGGIQVKTASYKMGYQMASSDAATYAAGAGHTYGLLGQGTANFAAAASAFQWKTASATAAHFMMVSILPYAATMGTLAASEVITVAFTARAFGTATAAISKPA
jgi:hypothetical protein